MLSINCKFSRSSRASCASCLRYFCAGRRRLRAQSRARARDGRLGGREGADRALGDASEETHRWDAGWGGGDHRGDGRGGGLRLRRQATAARADSGAMRAAGGAAGGVHRTSWRALAATSLTVFDGSIAAIRM